MLTLRSKQWKLFQPDRYIGETPPLNAPMTNSREPRTGLTSLINYVELWTPHEDAIALESAVVFDPADVRALPTGDRRTSKGQGIAGSAWQQEGAVIMHGPSAYLDEVVTAAGTSVKALIAIPVYCEFTLLNVIVLGLAEGNAGLEIWTRDDRDELSVSGSYYDGLSSFEFISRYVRFPKGAGLPGSCWKTGRPRMIDAPDQDPDFIRSFDRDPAKPEQCIGVPISREYGFPASILLLLSDIAKPLAKHVDILRCETGETDGVFGPKFKSSHSGETLPWMIAIVESIGKLQTALTIESGDVLLPEGYRYGIAMPFFADKQVEDVLVMLF